MDHKISLFVNGHDDAVKILRWCYDNVDRHHLNWEYRYDLSSDNNLELYFRDPKVAIIVTMKWS